MLEYASYWHFNTVSHAAILRRGHPVLKGTNMNIVIFGSALTNPADARDVDVAYAGEWNEAHERLVREWATDRGVPTSTPLELHPQHPSEKAANHGREISIPSPCGTEVPFEVIEGEAEVRIKPMYTFSAGLRAYGHNPAEFILRLRTEMFSSRVSLLPPEETDYWGVPSGGWDKYCEGLKALQSALRHVAPTELAIIADSVDNGKILTDLAKGIVPASWRVRDEYERMRIKYPLMQPNPRPRYWLKPLPWPQAKPWDEYPEEYKVAAKQVYSDGWSLARSVYFNPR